MVLLINQHNFDQHRAVMEDVYRFRHRLFVEAFGWEALRKCDGREIDQFDTDRCWHLVGLENSSVCSYSRFLPTTEPHLLSSVYPEIMDGADYPRGPDIWEWTRLAVDPAKREGRGGLDPASAQLFTAAAEACRLLGVRAILGQGHPFMLTKLLELGWDAKPLSLPRPYDGGLILPVYGGVTDDLVEVTRRAVGLSGQVLETDLRHQPPPTHRTPAAL